MEEFKSDVCAYISQHVVVAHAKTIHRIVAAGIPAIDGGHAARIGSHETRERKDPMAVVAAAR